MGCDFLMEGLLRHAKLYGTEEVYEAAEDCRWPPSELGRLAMQLRRVDSDWKLSTEQRDELALRLIAAKVPDDRIIRMAGISLRGLKRLQKTALESQEIVPNSTPLGDRTNTPDLASEGPQNALDEPTPSPNG